MKGVPVLLPHRSALEAGQQLLHGAAEQLLVAPHVFHHRLRQRRVLLRHVR